MICMTKITNETKDTACFVGFLYAIGFTPAVNGIRVPKNSIKM